MKNLHRSLSVCVIMSLPDLLIRLLQLTLLLFQKRMQYITMPLLATGFCHSSWMRLSVRFLMLVILGGPGTAKCKVQHCLIPVYKLSYEKSAYKKFAHALEGRHIHEIICSCNICQTRLTSFICPYKQRSFRPRSSTIKNTEADHVERIRLQSSNVV